MFKFANFYLNFQIYFVVGTDMQFNNVIKKK
jgi:hypothetical protein